jgi:mono/diheme cytochrome c family protein
VLVNSVLLNQVLLKVMNRFAPPRGAGTYAGAFLVLLTGTALASNSAVSSQSRHDRGRNLVLDACTACHTLERVTRQHYTAGQWRGVIAGMLSEGVPLTDDETTLVVDYLEANFGPEPR